MHNLNKLAESIYFRGEFEGWEYEEMLRHLVMDTTTKYLSSINNNALPEPEDALSELSQITIDVLNEFYEIVDEFGGTNMLLPVLEELYICQVVQLILLYDHVVVLPGNGVDTLIPGSKHKIMFYHAEGDKEGIYTECLFEALLRFYPDSTIEEIVPMLYDVNRLLPDFANRRKLYSGRELVAVNNGIFSLRTKKLMPFTPKHVFDTKWPVDYVIGPDGPVMRCPNGAEWDIDSWVQYFTQPVDNEFERECRMPAIWFLNRSGRDVA